MDRREISIPESISFRLCELLEMQLAIEPGVPKIAWPNGVGLDLDVPTALWAVAEQLWAQLDEDERRLLGLVGILETAQSFLQPGDLD